MNDLNKAAISFLLFIIFGFNAIAQDIQVGAHWKAGAVHFDANKWTEVIVGDMPLVISVPHGGALNPDEIPDRVCKGAVTVTDGRTIQTVRAIEAAFLEKYNKRPYIVISHLSRKKVDQNREIEIATCGNALAKQGWNTFHASIDTALADAVKQFGHAVYIDFHGQSHPNLRLELGYSLTKENLQAIYEGKEIDQAKRTSMQNYLRKHTDVTLQELLFGDRAFGSLIYALGAAATPAAQDPHPVADEAFFSGGYNTRRYTSERHPEVYGWQIEANNKGIRDTEENRKTFAFVFVQAFTEFMETNPF